VSLLESNKMILDEIVAHNRGELENRLQSRPLAEVRRMALEQPPALDFAAALQGDRVRLIAEVKRASPSKGVIRPDADPVEIARVYALNGASAISVLTETKHFQGSLQDLRAIRDALDSPAENGSPSPSSSPIKGEEIQAGGEVVGAHGHAPSPGTGGRGLMARRRTIPLLRKDFLFDPYHIYESRAFGADALLLIVAILTLDRLKELLFLSHQLGLKCLVEVHNEAELAVALKTEARIIGINNRNLDTLNVSLNTTKRLRAYIPPDRIVVSESGIKDHEDVATLRHLRVDAILVGEALMSAPDIPAKMKELL
jgi:indole-3-glycerol phosphate synthase